MRFLISFNDERKAYACTNYFNEQGISSIYEAAGKIYSIWVIDEDDFEKAKSALEKFEGLSPEERIRLEKPKAVITPKIVPTGSRPDIRVRLQQLKPPKRVSHPLTFFLILVCAVLFFWNSFQEAKLIKQEGTVAAEVGLTEVQKELLFDYPACYQLLEDALEKYPVNSLTEMKDLSPEAQAAYAAADKCPAWKGIVENALGVGSFQAPMFEKIKKGEVWRLITPTFLHRDFLHILFNMAWLLILGRMIEERAGKWRMLLLVLFTGVISNVAQYLMGGPYFLGFSGVAVGMAGFIWMRQKVSPWEGYPISKGTLWFLFLFVLAMLLLEIISFTLQLFGIKGIIGNIANTAHIVGGLTGILLGRIHFFSKGPS